MEDTKKWWQSKGVIGSLVSVAALAARLFGFDIDPAAEQALIAHALEIGAAIGSMMGLYGRIVADKRIG